MAAMASDKVAVGGLEWRVTVPDGAAVTVESTKSVKSWLWSCAGEVRKRVAGFAGKVWKLGADDPRRVVHAFKVGLALTLVSLFYFTRPLYDGVGGAAMWAIMTVVVVFEYTVGGSLYKGFNRAAATSTAGALALGVHWVAAKSGAKMEPFVLSGSVFLLASAATFSRFLPTIKARFDYGITIFILTYSLVAVSGFRVDGLVALAQQRVTTIAIGIAICFAVCLLIHPVWAGEELHLLVVRNMDKLAGSIEATVEAYFDQKAPAEPSKSEEYKCVLNSKASEDSQALLARWEPAHGSFSFRHPWSEYLKLGAALRHCAYCIEALHGCINAEIQAPEDVKSLLSDASLRVGRHCAAVLKEAAGAVKAMRKSKSVDFYVADMNCAVQELKSEIRGQSVALTRAVQISAAAVAAPVMDVLPVFTAVSLLIEVSARVEKVVDAVDALADLASFKMAEDSKLEAVRCEAADDDGSQNESPSPELGTMKAPREEA